MLQVLHIISNITIIVFIVHFNPPALTRSPARASSIRPSSLASIPSSSQSTLSATRRRMSTIGTDWRDSTNNLIWGSWHTLESISEYDRMISSHRRDNLVFREACIEFFMSYFRAGHLLYRDVRVQILI